MSRARSGPKVFARLLLPGNRAGWFDGRATLSGRGRTTLLQGPTPSASGPGRECDVARFVLGETVSMFDQIAARFTSRFATPAHAFQRTEALDFRFLGERRLGVRPEQLV